MDRRRVLLTACLGGGMLASALVVSIAVLERGDVEVSTPVAVGSLWGQVVGVAAYAAARKVGEDRGRPIHPLEAAAQTAGMAAATSWLPYFISLGVMYARS